MAAFAISGVAAEEDESESENLFGLPSCNLPVYGAAPDAEPDDESTGVLLPGGTCLQLTGYVQVGYQRNRSGASVSPALSRLASGTTSTSSESTSVTAGFTATTARRVDGMFVGVTVSGLIADASGLQSGDGRFIFSEGSLRIERVLVGYASSRFNFWDAGDFWTGATYPQRSAALAAIDVWQADGLTVTFSVERPQISSVGAPSGLIGTATTATQRESSTPDFIAAVTYEIGDWTLFGATALRQLHTSTNNATQMGLAATVGASYEGEIFDATHRFSMQASIARNLPSYLGSGFDVQTIRSLVGGGENIRGYSAVASIGRDITDEISVNAYASVLDIEFPALQTDTGRVVSTRAAANIIYNPIEHFRIGLEYGVGRIDLSLPIGGRTRVLPTGVQLSPSGFTRVDASSLVLWAEWSF
jgi:hypothetical protein